MRLQKSRSRDRLRRIVLTRAGEASGAGEKKERFQLLSGSMPVPVTAMTCLTSFPGARCSLLRRCLSNASLWSVSRQAAFGARPAALTRLLKFSSF